LSRLGTILPALKPAILISCEHGGNQVPEAYAPLFRGASKVLESHRGWDPGALPLARELAAALDAPLVACTTSRLLVDLNRTINHPRLFSEWTRSLSSVERAKLLERFWAPHMERVEVFVREQIAKQNPVLHLSIHSFTPIWKEQARTVDIGFLFDPKRDRERSFVNAWLDALRVRQPRLRLRRNRPYRGTSDGLITNLRGQFEAKHYVGVELEVTQRISLGPAKQWNSLRGDIRAALLSAWGV
jgi:predicted N-formylglutamate amidohydrolase